MSRYDSRGSTEDTGGDASIRTRMDQPMAKNGYVVRTKVIVGTLIAVLVVMFASCAITYYAARGASKGDSTNDAKSEGGKDEMTNNPSNNDDGQNRDDNQNSNGAGSNNPESTKTPDVPEGTKTPEIDAYSLRLHNSLLPVSHALTLKVNLPGYKFVPNSKNNLTVEGDLKMELNVMQATDKIELNSVNVTISEGGYVQSGDTRINVKGIEYFKELQKVALHLESSIQPGKPTMLWISFTALISESLGGMYQAKYTTVSGVNKIAAVTQMEPTYARQMVPCFDEPEFKAVWNVTVIHPIGTSALGNGKEIGTESHDSMFSKTTFLPTPKMSSYLLAIVVSDFEFVEGKTKNGVRMRIYARPDAKHSMQYALEAGVTVLDYYEEYYGIRFPLQKQDMVAVPDFAAGAMENWGLITYREVDLLYDEKINSPANKVRVAVVIAHENAHMWFGDLVTMKWWDNLWLNEGFATLVQYFGTDAISQSNWKMLDQFLFDAVEKGMDIDSLASKHPLSFDITTVQEVEEAFDPITYEKGGSVLMMMRQLDQQKFQQGLKNYLNKFKYANARDDDLWESLSEEMKRGKTKGVDGGELDFVSFARQWTKQMGHPYVTITRQNDGSFKVTQKRYKKSENAIEAEKYRNNPYGYKWDVPLWIDEDGEKKFYWLKRDEDLIINSNAKFIVLNDGAYGFYRTNYGSDEEWQKVFDAFPRLSDRTKTRVMSDAFAMADIGQLSFPKLFDMLKTIEKEKDYMTVKMFVQKFTKLINRFGNEPERLPLEDLFRNIYHKITSKDVPKSSKNYPGIVDYIARKYKQDENYYNVTEELEALYLEVNTFGDEQAIAAISADYQKHVAKTCSKQSLASECSMVAGPLRDLDYCTSVKHGRNEEFELIYSLYLNELVSAEKLKLLSALTCTRDVVQLKKILVDAINTKTGFIRPQDLSKLFIYVQGNPIGQEFLRSFLFARWDELQAVNSATSIKGRIIESCLADVRTTAQLNEVTAFMKSHPETAKMDAFKISIESAQANIDWLAKYSKSIVDYLKNTA